jgi:hypothetical protein
MTSLLMACGVCFGNSDSDMAHGARLSVLFLLVLTYLVIGGGATAFFYSRSRARAGHRLEQIGSLDAAERSDSANA